MTHVVVDIALSTILALVGSLGHLVLSRLEARINRQDERLDRIEETLTVVRVEAAESRGRTSGHD